MDPVFTLQWPEFLLAQRLQKLFPKSAGYSVMVPVSRQEKGIDLAVVRKQPHGGSRTATFQVKASRTFSPDPPKTKRAGRRFRFYTWYNAFDVPDVADFFLLFGMYSPDMARTKPVGPSWYRDCTLLLSQAEMKQLMDQCRTVRGTPDRMFGFGFDDEKEVVYTRGDQHRAGTAYTEYLLQNRIEMLGTWLGANSTPAQNQG